MERLELFTLDVDLVGLISLLCADVHLDPVSSDLEVVVEGECSDLVGPLSVVASDTEDEVPGRQPFPLASSSSSTSSSSPSFAVSTGSSP